MQVYRVYTNERSDRPFSESLLVSVIVLAENEEDALKTVLKRYGNNLYFTCKDSELLVEVITESILSVEYNSF
jgi:hypothetical protein